MRTDLPPDSASDPATCPVERTAIARLVGHLIPGLFGGSKVHFADAAIDKTSAFNLSPTSSARAAFGGPYFKRSKFT